MTESPLWQSIGMIQPRGDAEHRYLLINQAAWHAQPEVIRGLQGFDRVALLGQPEDACQDGVTPFLLRLDGHIGNTAATRPLRVLCDTGCFASALSVIDATLTMHSLAAALSARCEARLTERQDVVLRYFDTRVLEAMLDVFSASQLSQLVACTTHWWLAGRSGVLEPIYISDWPTQDNFAPPWQLSQQQEEALVNASDADAMVDLLTRRSVEPLLMMPPFQRHPAVSSMLAQCKQWGLNGTSDQAAYCTVALMRGEDIARASPWDQLLPKVKRGELTFVEALEIAAQVD